MDGVFMFKIIKRILVLVLAAALVYLGTIYGDKCELQNELLRLHVVANSDSKEDQALKLQVRDAIIATLEKDMARVDTKEQAQALICSRLEKLEQVANETLAEAGSTNRATVTLEREPFDTRQYDTFTLPAGVYDSLRVTIGSGQGQNWWCVVFPGLCVPAASDGVTAVAVEAGLSDSLSGAIVGRKEYQVRFFLLDWMGRIENFFA